MKRFLMLVGVAVVAAAMYVAAGTASRQSRGPTAKQFKALKAQVTSLNKNLKSVRLEADAALGVIADCYLTIGASTANVNGLGVSQFGNTSTGFLFGNSTSSMPRTALDVAASGPTYYLQEVTPDCVAGNLLRHRTLHRDLTRLQKWANHTR